MSERIFQVIAFDPKLVNDFVGIKIEIEEGVEKAVIVAHGKDADEIHGAIKKDQHESPEGARYYFYKPQVGSNIREGWVIGGEIE